MKVEGWYKSVLATTAMIVMVGCSGGGGDGPGNIEEFNALEISSAVYDDKGTPDDTTDDILSVYFEKDIDDNSWSEPEFALTGNAVIAGATFNYTRGLPYKLTVTDGLSGFVPNTTEINVVAGGFEVDGVKTTTGDAVTVTAVQNVVESEYRSFTEDNDTGIVVDNDLRVTWQQSEEALGQNWSAANTICEDLMGPERNTDWRLPTINELVSLIDEGTSHPASYSVFNTPQYHYWTSTAYYNDNTYHWKVDFMYGSTTISSATATNSVRCVRGEPQPKHTFIADSTKKVVYDTNNGLIWDDSYQTLSDTNLTWAAASALCSDPWRLPTISELHSIVDYDKYNPSIDEAFNRSNMHWSADSYWSKTVDVENTANAWSIDFAAGQIRLMDKLSPDRQPSVRCVK